MQSNIFNSFFSFYMIFNYFIQPIFMVIVVVFLYRIVKHLGNIDKQNKDVAEKIQKEKSVDEAEVNDNIQ
ncbi:MAG: hypothetical protein N3I35_09715 [Clostridia bacterium]|nr:hypothetical protein [Clostridia bacterium]